MLSKFRTYFQNLHVPFTDNLFTKNEYIICISFREVVSKLLVENNIICYEAKHFLIYLMDHFNFDINRNFNIIDAKVRRTISKIPNLHPCPRYNVLYKYT